MLAIQETNMTKKKSTIALSAYDRAMFKEMLADSGSKSVMAYDKFKKKYGKPRPIKIK